MPTGMANNTEIANTHNPKTLCLIEVSLSRFISAECKNPYGIHRFHYIATF